jgi:hypothetical protein
LNEKDLSINVRKEGAFINPITGKFLELDVYISDLKIGFEFQVCVEEDSSEGEKEEKREGRGEGSEGE